MAKVGIKDIASQAGVSIATVSHAFRNPGRVSDETRKKVLGVAKELGYTPNRLAANLRTSKSGNIVVIIPDIADAHNSKIIRAIEKVAHSRGYSVLLGDTQGSEIREREFAEMTGSRQADGIILMSHRLPFDLGEDGEPLEELPPIVSGCEFTGLDSIPMVAIDDKQAGIDATNHLIAFGHKNIAVITGDMDTPSSRDRLDGFRQAMSQAGLQVQEDLIAYSMYTLRGGEEGAESLLRKNSRATAIFCFSDELALGCMYALRKNGFSIPEDISVMGFDGVQVGKYMSPSLTTVAQPTEEIGTTCATILLDLIDGTPPRELRNLLAYKLLIRESTRRLN